TAWHGQPVPDREWCVLNRIPMRNVTLFSGEGAIGKSIVSLQLAVAHVLGSHWLGTMPEIGPALVVACEDDADELHRRLSLMPPVTPPWCPVMPQRDARPLLPPRARTRELPRVT